MPFCISILTSVRRIVKIAVRFLHTKTALCDRKDTQSRFAVNAARSIVCVETSFNRISRNYLACFNAARSIVCVETNAFMEFAKSGNVSMPHAALCVSRLQSKSLPSLFLWRFNAARSIVCVETKNNVIVKVIGTVFQCRTQHCVCRDCRSDRTATLYRWFQCRTQHCVCRDAIGRFGIITPLLVSMPHAALCVSRLLAHSLGFLAGEVSMPHAALCVSRQVHFV